jgi:putative transposase
MGSAKLCPCCRPLPPTFSMTRYRRIRVEGGCYFFTVVTVGRRPLLIAHVDALRDAFTRTRDRHPFRVEAMVVLPDHLHAIWRLPPGDSNCSVRWAMLKRAFSRAVPAQARSPSELRKRELGVWQRRFWEHLIRSHEDLRAHMDYIHLNPVKHGYCAAPEEWPHSTYRQWLSRGGDSPASRGLPGMPEDWE